MAVAGTWIAKGGGCWEVVTGTDFRAELSSDLTQGAGPLNYRLAATYSASTRDRLLPVVVGAVFAGGKDFDFRRLLSPFFTAKISV